MTHARAFALTLALGTFGALAGATTASAGGGCHAGVTEGSGTTVEMVEACFTPTVLSIDPGGSVTWVNRSGMVHNVTANLWGHFDDIADGERVTVRFDDEGTYPYACTYHPGMSGVVVVGDGDGPGNGEAVDVAPVEGPPTGEGTQAQAGAALAATPATDDAFGWVVPGALGLLAGAGLGATVVILRRRETTDRGEEQVLDR